MQTTDIFSYAGLARFLTSLSATRRIIPLGEWNGQDGVILRHDVDVDIDAAVALAELEHGIGLRSTFFIRVTGPTYNPASPAVRRALQRLMTMGFEIGLHFDPSIYELDQLTEKLEWEGRFLGDLVDARIGSISLHNPSGAGSFPIFPGWLNAYDPAIFAPDRYLSDSRMVFQTPPEQFFLTAPATSQLLLHPYHYSADGACYPHPMARHCAAYVDRLHKALLANSAYSQAIDNGHLMDWLGQDAGR